MARTLVAALLLSVAAGALTGCGNNPYPPEGDKVVLHSALGEDPKSLDPVAASDTLSNAVICQIYDSLYQFHYLKRPYTLIPNLAAAMPTYSPDGLTLSIPLRKGIRFQDDPCFVKTGGKGREVVAADFVYSVKRLADVATKSNGWWTLAGKVVGLDKFHQASVEAAKAGRTLDYAAFDVPGLQAPDRYTIRIRLTQKYPQLKYILAMSFTALVPHEAVEFYGKEFVNHPVGTGAFRLDPKKWKKQQVLILERNPTYRPEFYPSEGALGDREKGLLDDAGKRLPLADEIRYTIFKESQPMWIFFLQGYCDASGIPKDNFDKAVPDGQDLAPELKQRGIRLHKRVRPDVYYWAFNMRDPVVGRHPDPEQDRRNRKLRQAMSCAYDRERTIRVFRNGRGLPAKSMLPPGFFGYDPDLKNPYAEFNLPLARKLLAEAGYPGGKDARGRQLVLPLDTTADSVAGMQMTKAFVRDMAQLGIKIEIVQNTWAQLQKKVRESRVTLYSMGWIMDFPDPQNFLQLLYGPNKSPGPNGSHYDNPEYNRLYEQMEVMDDTPERLRIIRRMIEIVNEDCPWILDFHSKAYVLYHCWARNRKPNDISGNFAKYLAVDTALREKLTAEWNRMAVTPLFVLAGMLVAVFAAAVFVGRHLPPRLATRRSPETH